MDNGIRTTGWVTTLGETRVGYEAGVNIALDGEGRSSGDEESSEDRSGRSELHDWQPLILRGLLLVVG